jgi:hypothetical protein
MDTSNLPKTTADGFVRGSKKFGFGFGSSWYEVLLISAGATLALLTIVLYIFQCTNHVRHWRHPDLQKCYLRIAMIAPTYAFFSWLSIARSSEAANYDTFRAMFEGYALWTFFAMMIYCAGGEAFFHDAYQRNENIVTTTSNSLSSSSSSLYSSSIPASANLTREKGNDEENEHFLSNNSKISDEFIATTITATTNDTTSATTSNNQKTITINDEDDEDTTDNSKNLKIRCYFFPPMKSCGYCGYLWEFQSSLSAIICWKLCLIQFLIIKPCLSMYTAWSEKNDRAMQTDKFVKPFALISVTLAMWALLSTYLALEPVSLSLRKINIPSKFIVIKCAIFLTVAQELTFHILVASGVISSPYCWWVGPSEKCLDLMGFQTPSARRGVRTIATLVILEMFLLQFLLLKYYSFSDVILGDILSVSDNSINIIEFFLKPTWNIEPTTIKSRSLYKNNNDDTSVDIETAADV